MPSKKGEGKNRNLGRLSGLKANSGLNLTYKDLIKITAKRSGYYEYEVKDILDNLGKVIQEVLCKQGTIKYKGVGTIAVKVYGAKEWYDFKREQWYKSDEAYTMKFRTDMLLRRLMNPEKHGIEPRFKDKTVLLEGFDTTMNSADFGLIDDEDEDTLDGLEDTQAMQAIDEYLNDELLDNQ